MLLRCCLIQIIIIILRFILYLIYLCTSPGQGLFMSYLHDLFFIFSIIFIVIYHITTFKQTYLFFVHFLGYLLLYKRVKNFQKVKVRPQGAASLLLNFLPISAWHCQGSTVTLKLPYMMTYVCQTFVIRDVRGQIPKRI